MKRLRLRFKRNRYLWSGVGGVVVIVALLLAMTTIGTSDGDTNTYVADFAQAGGIRPGDMVRVAGIDVGKVSDTALRGDHVQITMKVSKEVTVTANGSAEIKLSTLLGQRYIDVSLGNSPSRVTDGRITETRVPYDLQQTIEKGTPVLQGVDSRDLANSIRSLNRQLAGAPAVTKPTLDSLSRMSEIITNRQDQISQLIDDTASVTAIVNDSSGQLAVIVGQGQQLAGKVVAREALLTRLLDGIAAVSNEAQQIAAENGNQFAPIMANLNTISQGLEKNRANLRKLLEVVPVTARVTNNALGDGPYTNTYLPWGIFPDNWLCLARLVDQC